jgi:hypothetical protein
MPVAFRACWVAVIVATALLGGWAPASSAQVKPPASYSEARGFRLLPRAFRRWIGNRVQCHLTAPGQICSAEGSTVGGGYWPARTSNQYIFNTGLQVAGIIDSASVSNPWAGDIEGAFFFNARGGGNGQAVTDIYEASDAADLSAWPAEAGTVWALRDYVGAITGGNGFGGNDGPYAFFPVVRPFAATGASVRLTFTASTNIANAWDRDLRRVHTVPDPYYVTNSLESSASDKVIKFVNLPDRAIIRIYSVSGVLVAVIEHNSAISSEAFWDVRSRNGHIVASGVYFYHIEALNARRVGRMTIINTGRR